MKTIAQQKGITSFPYQEFDSNGREIYYENSSGYWCKREFDSNGNRIYYEDSSGFWSRREYDSKGNRIYFEDSDGDWCKYEYDSKENQIYYEDSDGKIEDKRPKPVVELTMEELVQRLGYEVKIKK